MMELVYDWKKVVQYAWSFRLMGISAVLTGLEVALPLFQHRLPIPNGLLAAGSGILAAAALSMRLISQKKFREG